MRTIEKLENSNLTQKEVEKLSGAKYQLEVTDSKFQKGNILYFKFEYEKYSTKIMTSASNESDVIEQLLQYV